MTGPEKEVEFAKGSEVETQRMRVTYKVGNIYGFRFPVIYQTYDDGSVGSMELTEAEGRWLADVLTRFFRDTGD